MNEINQLINAKKKIKIIKEVMTDDIEKNKYLKGLI